jgi:hypothetical protein
MARLMCHVPIVAPMVWNGMEDPCSKLQRSSTLRNAVSIMIRPLTPPQAAGDRLAFAVQKKSIAC